MANLNKEKLFKDRVFEIYHSLEKFDKINFTLLKIRKIMIADNPNFDKSKVEDQVQYCTTIYHIFMNSKRSIMKEISMFNRNIDDDIRKYDPESGFTEPEYVTIIDKLTGQQMLVESL